MTAVQGGAFGKLPTTADFVRHNAAAPEVRTFDAWLEEGIVLARQTLGAAWQDAYDRAPPCRFVFQPRDGQNALVGVTVPGIDAAGRRFPFSVFRFLDRRDATNSWRDLPLALDEFLAAAERVAVEASRYSWSRERVREETDGLLRTGADDFARARERYQSFARETTFGALLGALPGVSGETAPGRTLQGLREVLRAVVTSGRGGVDLRPPGPAAPDGSRLRERRRRGRLDPRRPCGRRVVLDLPRRAVARHRGAACSRGSPAPRSRPGRRLRRHSPVSSLPRLVARPRASRSPSPRTRRRRG